MRRILLPAFLLAACAEPQGPNLPPTVQIVEPAGGVQLLVGDSLVLRAQASDPEDGQLGGDAVVWRDAAGTMLGMGERVVLRLEREGPHEVVVEARDRSGLTAEARLAFDVGANSAPVLEVEAPGGLPFYAELDSVMLVATASDAESGAIEPERIVWASDVAGELGTGDTLVVLPGVLGAGAHRITATARDPQGLEATASLAMIALAPQRLIWARRLGPVVQRGGVVALSAAGVIVAGSYFRGGEPRIVALDAGGEVLWEYPLMLWDHSSALSIAQDGTVYAMDRFGEAAALTPDGTELWRTRTLEISDLHGRFALGDDGALYVAGNGADAFLARVSPADGSTLWEIHRSGGFRSGAYLRPDGHPAAVLGGSLVIADPDGTLVLEAPDITGGRAVGAMDREGAIYVPVDDGVMAMNADGTPRWEVTLPLPPGFHPERSEPMVAGDGRVFAAVLDEASAYILAIRPDGSFVWSRDLPRNGADAVYRPRLAITADDGVYAAVGTHLYALGRARGGIRWSIELAYPISSGLAVAPDGTVYFETAEGRGVAIQGDAPLDPAAPWATLRADNRRTSSVRPLP